MAKITGIAAGFDNAIYCVDDADRIWSYNVSTRTWRMDPIGKARQISAASAFHVWVVNDAGQIWQQTINGWRQDRAPQSARQVSVGDDGDVWFVATGGELWYQPFGEDWRQPQANARAVQVEVGDRNHVLCVNNKGEMFRWLGGNWVELNIPFTAKHVSVGANGEVMATSTSDEIWSLTRGTEQWVKDNTGRAAQVSIGDTDSICCLNAAGEIFQRIGTQWVRLPSPQPSEGDYFIYVVRQGDTLARIAARFGTTVARLARDNNISDPDRIQIGQQLRINRGGDQGGGDPGRYYTIKAGDTLLEIAQRFNISLVALLAANPHITNPDRIVEGDVLLIPSR